MSDVLVDTDVCIDHLAGRRRLPGRHTRRGYSVITRAELLAGARNDAELNQVRRLLGTMTEYEVTRQIAEKAGQIRREAGIRLPDALIAATALIRGSTVHTRNVADFRRVPGLRLQGTG